MLRRLPLCALTCALFACDQDPARPTPTATWTDAPADPVVASVILGPTAVQRLAAAPRVALPTTGAIVEVTRDGAPLRVADGVVADPVAGGDVLEVAWTDDLGVAQIDEVVVPEAPADAQVHYALAGLQRGDGTIWTATPHHGLVGLAADGTVVRKAGVPTAAPWDPAFAGPQSDLVLSLAPEGRDALWVGSAVTGVSWFDPAGDTWIHGQPEVSGFLGNELAQTPVALAPDGDRGVWVASLNGLWHARLAGSVIDWERATDGAALAAAVDGEGRVWAGYSLAQLVEPEGTDAQGRAYGTPLASPGGTLAMIDPEDGTVTWALADLQAVTAVLPRAGRVWLGTPHGLARATRLAGEIGVELLDNSVFGLDEDLAVTGLAAARDGGLWVAAHAECEADRGRLLKIELDAAGEVARVVDHGTAGFGERDFAWARELDDGSLLVSTYVPTISPFVAPEPLTARGCQAPLRGHADLYVYRPAASGVPAVRGDGRVTRFGE